MESKIQEQKPISLEDLKKKILGKAEKLYSPDKPSDVFKPPVKREQAPRSYTTETFKGSSEGLPVEVKLSNSDKMKYFDCSDEQATQLRFTNISLYSTTPHDQADYTTELLYRYFDHDSMSKLSITDGNSCIGGNTQSFAKVFGQVNAIELNPLHMECLKTNMSVLGYKNVNFLEGNIMDYITKLSADVLFLDPPWGGVDYKTKAVSLYYTDNDGVQHTMNDIINGSAGLLNRVVMLKAPKNFDIEPIKKETMFKYVESVPILVNKRYVSYVIYIFSHILPKTGNPTPQSFKSLNYKEIRFSKVA